MTDVVTLAVPCRRDEPALGRTLAAAAASCRRAGIARVEMLVCLNGAGGDRPRDDACQFAADARAPFAEIDVDVDGTPLPSPGDAALAIRVLATRRAGKPVAWNVLRRAARGAMAIFLDADVSFGDDAFGLLLDTLARTPDAVLASAKTTCAPRPGPFEAIMAAPYGVDFPNLSAQLYAARVAELPATMPDDLIEPERWLELVVGRERVVRVPAARVTVRLPGTLADFFRQRIRIEMGKVQLARCYPGLDARGARQPRGRAALASLATPEVARLAAYLALRSAAHAIAWWRWRQGETADVWRQAATTKQWDAGR
jgi:hypothetical protein